MSIRSIIYEFPSATAAAPHITESIEAAMKACGVERVKVRSDYELLTESYQIAIRGDYSQDIVEEDMIDLIRAELHRVGIEL